MVSPIQDHLGFVLHTSCVRNSILIPRYYNPEINERLRNLEITHQLISLGELKEARYLSADTGHEIGKMAYGTGEIPFLRTSDIVNWELKADPKQGVSHDIYTEYADKQDIQAGDIFFVRDGTYLIGQTCLLSEKDIPCLYQSHILKLRLKSTAPISPFLLLACLNSPIVRRQIRAKQFTADIIDTIGNRYLELILPIPKNIALRDCFSKEIGDNLSKRVEMRECIRRIPLWLEGHISSIKDPIPDGWCWREEFEGNHGFTRCLSEVRQGILIPKYGLVELFMRIVRKTSSYLTSLTS